MKKKYDTFLEKEVNTIHIEHIDDIYSFNRILNSHCSIAIDYLIKIAEGEGLEGIEGRLVSFDKNYFEKMLKFFKNHKFNIDNCIEGKEITISRRIK